MGEGKWHEFMSSAQQDVIDEYSLSARFDAEWNSRELSYSDECYAAASVFLEAHAAGPVVSVASVRDALIGRRREIKRHLTSGARAVAVETRIDELDGIAMILDIDLDAVASDEEGRE